MWEEEDRFICWSMTRRENEKIKRENSANNQQLERMKDKHLKGIQRKCISEDNVFFDSIVYLSILVLLRVPTTIRRLWTKSTKIYILEASHMWKTSKESTNDFFFKYWFMLRNFRTSRKPFWSMIYLWQYCLKKNFFDTSCCICLDIAKYEKFFLVLLEPI